MSKDLPRGEIGALPVAHAKEESRPPRRGIVGFRALFGLLGVLFAIPAIGELWTGKAFGRHGTLIATRESSPVAFWLLAILSVGVSALMLFLATRPVGRTK